MIKNNYESQLKNIQIDDKFLEKKQSLLLENKNNASIRAFNNIQRKDIILLKDVSNIFFLEKIYDKKLEYNVIDKNRTGDHIWYISDLSKIKRFYPNWNKKYNLHNIYTDF